MPTDIQKERLRALTADLRSGKHKQVKHLMQTSSGFCCLGRACDLSGLGKWVESYSAATDHPELFYIVDGRLGSELNLPVDVQDWYGFKSAGGFSVSTWRIDHSDGTRKIIYQTLGSLNDDGLTFSQIADIIDWEYAL